MNDSMRESISILAGFLSCMICSVPLVVFFLIHSRHKIQLLATLALARHIEEHDTTGWITEFFPKTYIIQKTNLEIEPYKILKVKDFALQYQLLSQEIILNQ